MDYNEKSLDQWQQDAETGDLSAQLWLYDYYYNDQSDPCNINESVKWCLMAAEQGDPVSQYNLGMHFLFGRGVNEDIDLALRWFRMAALNDIPEALGQLGEIYLYGHENSISTDPKLATRYLEKAKNNGDSRAATLLARCLIDGNGVPKDENAGLDILVTEASGGNLQAINEIKEFYQEHDLNEDAFLWCKKAAELGDVSNQFDLGLYYNLGKGCPQDIDEAIHWFSKAAEEGVNEALINLGVIFWKENSVKDIAKAIAMFHRATVDPEIDVHIMAYRHLGCIYLEEEKQRNISEAIRCLTIAANAGDTTSMHLLAELYVNGKYIETDYASALNWIRKAAKHGDFDAFYNLGNFYLYGAGTERDPEMALEWFKKAADHGSADSMFKIGLIFDNEKKYQDNPTASLEWYTRAANEGQPEAMLALGEHYLHAIGVPRDVRKAFEYFRKSAETGSPDGLYLLSRCYQDGWGVPVDKVKALEMCTAAAQQGQINAANRLADYYLHEISWKECDLEKSMYWRQKAAEGGDEHAKQIFDIYEKLKSVPFDSNLIWDSVYNGDEKDFKLRFILSVFSNVDLSRLKMEKTGQTPLHYAAINGMNLNIEPLLDRGVPIDDEDARLNATAFQMAVITCHPETAKLLYELGADIYRQDNLGKTALHWAVERFSEADFPLWLLEQGLSPDLKDRYNLSPLGYAILHKRNETVKVLVEHGASVQARYDNGTTPLHYAASIDNPEIVQYLIDKGALLHAQNNDGVTPLYFAICQNCLNNIKCLEENGVDLTLPPLPNWNAMTIAGDQGTVEVMSYLCSRGIDINSTNREGENVLHRTALNGNVSATKWILRNHPEIEINKANNDGNTPLHYAIQSGNIEVIQLLLNHDANISLVNNEGQTPLACVRSYRVYLIRWLKSWLKESKNIAHRETSPHSSPHPRKKQTGRGPGSGKNPRKIRERFLEEEINEFFE